MNDDPYNLPEKYWWIRANDSWLLKQSFRASAMTGPVLVLVVWLLFVADPDLMLHCPPQLLDPEVGHWGSAWPKLKWEVNSFIRRDWTSFGPQYCHAVWSMFVVCMVSTIALSIVTFGLAIAIGKPAQWKSRSSRRGTFALFFGTLGAIGLLAYIPVPALIAGPDAVSYKLPPNSGALLMSAMLFSVTCPIVALMSVVVGKMLGFGVRALSFGRVRR